MRTFAMLLVAGLFLAAGSAASWTLTGDGFASAAVAHWINGKQIKAGSIPATKLDKPTQALIHDHATDGVDGQSIIGPQGIPGVGLPSTVPGPVGAASTVPGPQGIQGVPGNAQIPQMDTVPHCNPGDTTSQGGLRFVFPVGNALYLCDGNDGQPGPGPTLEQVNDGVLRWCTTIQNPGDCKGPQGDRGPVGASGQNATDTQVSSAVNTYCGAHDSCRGQTGPRGADGRDAEPAVPGTDCAGLAPTTPARTCPGTGGGTVNRVTKTADVASGSVEATCPSGSALGGGYSGIETGGVVVKASMPTATGWRVQVDSSQAVTLTVYAVCLT